MNTSKSGSFSACMFVLCIAITTLLCSCQTYHRPNDDGWYELTLTPRSYEIATKYREGDVDGPLFYTTYADEKRTTLKVVGSMTVFTNSVPCASETIDELKISGTKSNPEWEISGFAFYGTKPVNVRLRFDGDLGRFVEERGGISLWYPPFK